MHDSCFEPSRCPCPLPLTGIESWNRTLLRANRIDVKCSSKVTSVLVSISLLDGTQTNRPACMLGNPTKLPLTPLCAMFLEVSAVFGFLAGLSCSLICFCKMSMNLGNRTLGTCLFEWSPFHARGLGGKCTSAHHQLLMTHPFMGGAPITIAAYIN